MMDVFKTLNPRADLQKAKKQMPEIVCVAISILGGAACWWLDCVPVTAIADVNLARNPTLHLSKLTYKQGVKQLIYVEMKKDSKVCLIV